MREKWNLDIGFDKNSPLKKADFPKKEMAGLKEHVRRDTSTEIRDELEKTKEEETIIHRINEAIARFLRSYELPLLTISTNSVHIIKAKELNKDFPDKHGGAYFKDGNIFLARSVDKDIFIRYVTHEATHELAYNKLNLHQEDEHNHSLRKRRRGLTINKQPKIFGNGFDEGITETIADKLRLEYAKIAKLGPKQTESLTDQLKYIQQIIVIESICKKINPENQAGELDLFIKAFITGDKNIYKNLNNKFREQGINNGLKILMAMGTESEDALTTAKQLGLDEAVSKIEKIKKEESKQ